MYTSEYQILEKSYIKYIIKKIQIITKYIFGKIQTQNEYIQTQK